MSAAATPMMAQFLGIKENYPDALLFYRMGDFYELFFDDAVAAAEALDIALTKRGKHLGEDIPMCGVPVHSSENYLLTLIRKGFRVAVCEQLEDPAEAKKRGSKSVVKRDVVRLVTSGTLTEETLLEPKRNNFLAAFVDIRDSAGLAWIDMSTGEFNVTECSLSALSLELARLSPPELLIPDTLVDQVEDLAVDAGVSLTPLPRRSFDSTSAEMRLTDVLSVASLDGFGRFGRAEISAMGAIIDYLDLTQKGVMPRILPPKQERAQGTVQIDAATRRNLELTQTLDGDRKGSLLSVIDRTATASGARLLEKMLASPSMDLEVLKGRHESVAFFFDQQSARVALREALKECPDLDRALSRLALSRGGPRDLGIVRTALEKALTLTKSLESADLSDNLSSCLQALEGHEILLEHLTDALDEELPVYLRDGGMVRKGFSEDLDQTRQLRDDGRTVISKLQAEYSTETGISALKIKHNNVLGYFIETPATHADKMLSSPLSEKFNHRQTTANAVRFNTLELSETESAILNAAARTIELEKGIFDDLTAKVMSEGPALSECSAALAELDVYVSLADLASENHWCRPKLDDSHEFEIVDGRHPVVEMALQSGGETPFISNSCDLSKNAGTAALWILTGPNMSGKSTFLRQNALIAILAQIGSFVPAKAAHIGLVSQVFSRVGASDDLARGRSTFMVEMVETAAILNQADQRALVILDEIGRGTATYDGLSIAWATLEHLHAANKCRALFATHYHELTTLAPKLDGVENATVSVKEWEGEVVFLHEVKRGAADRSYGVQVAKLAGLPDAVVGRAHQILEYLEKGERETKLKPTDLVDELPLFAATPTITSQAPSSSVLEDRLGKIEPDELTPKEALNLLYELKTLSRS